MHGGKTNNKEESDNFRQKTTTTLKALSPKEFWVDQHESIYEVAGSKNWDNNDNKRKKNKRI